MAGNATFESASASSSELAFSGGYLNGQRLPGLDRSVNYREGSDRRMIGSGFGMLPRGGSGSMVTSNDIHTLSQSISLDPIVIRHQIAWYDELRRVLGNLIGSTAEENSFKAAATYLKPLPSMADIKSFRLSVEDTCVKARVRANKMDERLRKLDKYCEYLTSKKQKRNELASIGRSGALNLKMSTQIFRTNQRVEDRPKNILLNKRVRTSMAESRAKDGNLLEDNAGESDLFEKIRSLAAGGEGWEKRGKRKRSIGTVPTRHTENDGVPKRAVQNKVVVENVSQPRDAHIYRFNNNSDDLLSNRKRPIPSSIPMAAQWGSQRPQKMARARRPFLVSFASNQDEKRFTFESSSPPDVSARLTNGSKNDPKKLVGNIQSSPRLSESHEESVGGQTDNGVETTGNKNRPFINSLTSKPFQNRKTGCKKNRRKPGRRLKKLSDRNHDSPLQNVSSPDCPGASDDDREELLAAANHAPTASYLACSSPFWKKMEPVFASVSSEDKSFLTHQVDSISDPLLSENVTRGMDITSSKESIPLYQRVLSALIIEDDIDTPEEEDMQFISSFGVSTLNGSAFENTGLVDKLLLELYSIGLYPDMMPVLEDEENETIQYEMDKLNARLHQHGVKKKAYLEKISINTDSIRDLETLAMDRLVELAYRKLLPRRSSRSGVQKVPKQAALAFGSRTLARCHKFENSGVSCFNDPPFHDILSAPSDDAFSMKGQISNRGKKKQDDTKMRKTKQNTNPRQQTPKSDNKHTGTTHPTGPTWVSSSSNRVVNDDVDPLDDLGVPHDLTSFLNFDEQDPDVDFTAGLDIPMDDLTELF